MSLKTFLTLVWSWSEFVFNKDRKFKLSLAKLNDFKLQ